MGKQADRLRGNSWMIIEKATGNVICETFNQNHVRQINTEKYEAIDAYDYLLNLNKKLKAERDGKND